VAQALPRLTRVSGVVGGLQRRERGVACGFFALARTLLCPAACRDLLAASAGR